MTEYPKIMTLWKRDEKGRIIPGEYSIPACEYLADNAWVWTEKVDGTNIRVMWDGKLGEEYVEFGGKTDNAQLPARLVKHLEETFTEEKMAKKFGAEAVCLYGEGYGAGIQKGGAYGPDQKFILFDVKIGKWWLKRDALVDIADALGIPVVPLVLVGTIAQAEKLVRYGYDSTLGPAPFPAEGLVGKPLADLLDRNGDRIIVKIKTRDYAHLKAAA